MTEGDETIAVLGGTGALGGSLARRFARAGRRVLVGSRDPARAAEAAAEIAAESGAEGRIEGRSNVEAAAEADVAFVTIPFASHEQILGTAREALAGKLVIDATVPLAPPKVATFHAPPDGSAALAARRILGERVALVTALQTVAAHKLREDRSIDSDVLVFGDQVAARERVIRLLAVIGLRGLHAGRLENAVAAEAMTSILVGINKRYGAGGAGIRITGVGEPTAGA